MNEGHATQDAPRPARSRTAAALDFLLSVLPLRFTRLGREMRHFAESLEECAFREARERHQEVCRISVGRRKMSLASEDSERVCGALRLLPGFLASLGVRELVLDSELESDQVRDVMEMLHQIGRALRGVPGPLDGVLGRTRAADMLTGRGGLHMSCAQVTLERPDGRLRIGSSYCALPLSRAISAYVRKKARFRDHRAFFKAAPRYAVAAALVVLAPALVALTTGGPRWAVGMTAAIMAVVAGLGTYVVFQIIGSEEYDKEHQARVIKRRHYALERTHEKIRRDLETARTIQRTLLPDPRIRPFPRRLSFAIHFAPEMAVGGDYYDLKQLDGHRLAVLLADVSGHGMSAAFVTGLIKTTIEYGRTHDRPCREFLAELNDVLCRLTPPDNFAAVVFGIYDVESHVLTYANAGHSPVPVVIRSGGRLELLDAPVNLLAGIYPQMPYDQGEVILRPGDKLVLATDGITDSADPSSERFGLERFHALLKENASLSADALCKALVETVERHVGPAEQADDSTLLIMEVLK